MSFATEQATILAKSCSTDAVLKDCIRVLRDELTERQRQRAFKKRCKIVDSIYGRSPMDPRNA